MWRSSRAVLLWFEFGGRLHRHQTVTVTVSETTLAIELTDGDTKVIRRTTTQPVRSIKGQRPRIATHVS